MNRRRNRNPESVPEHEWLLQERAFEQARTEHAPDAGEPGLAPYRRIADALRREPTEARLPSNFAWQVAQLVERLPRAARLDFRLEHWLVRSLVAAMALGALAAAGLYGANWLRGLDASGSTGTWLVLLAGCMALTALPEAVQRWRSLRD